jgi:hypothetical protein
MTTTRTERTKGENQAQTKDTKERGFFFPLVSSNLWFAAAFSLPFVRAQAVRGFLGIHGFRLGIHGFRLGIHGF